MYIKIIDKCKLKHLFTLYQIFLYFSYIFFQSNTKKQRTPKRDALSSFKQPASVATSQVDQRTFLHNKAVEYSLGCSGKLGSHHNSIPRLQLI